MPLGFRSQPAAVGKGLFAVACGSLAITAVTMAEAKLAGKEESTAPADAVKKVLEVEPTSQASKTRLGFSVRGLPQRIDSR